MNHTHPSTVNVCKSTYEPRSATLYLVFSDHSANVYDDVPEVIWQDLAKQLSAEAATEYFKDHIDGRFVECGITAQYVASVKARIQGRMAREQEEQAA